MGLSLRRPCRCGHAKDAHAHYRRGTDCSGCACERFHGLLEITVRFGRLQPLRQVVMPDEVPAAEQPWLRPTHTAGLTAYPEPYPQEGAPEVHPLVRQHLAAPRAHDDAAPVVHHRA